MTYEITCEKGLPADKVKLVKSFLSYTASDEGQAALTTWATPRCRRRCSTKVKHRRRGDLLADGDSTSYPRRRIGPAPIRLAAQPR